MSTTYKADGTRRPHPSDTQPRQQRGMWGHRDKHIGNIAAATPGTPEHAAALRAAVEHLLAPRRQVNTGIDVIAHNPQLVHAAYAAGPIAYTTWIKAAGLSWHRPLRTQLKRWQQHAAAQQPAA